MTKLRSFIAIMKRKAGESITGYCLKLVVVGTKYDGLSFGLAECRIKVFIYSTVISHLNNVAWYSE